MQIKYMGNKVISDTELHSMWQEQQQRNRRSEGNDNDKLSTSDKASTKYSKSIDSQPPLSRLNSVADGGMAPESNFCGDDYAPNEVDLSSPLDPKPRFHGGSETESENDFEYGVAPRYCQSGGLKGNGQSTGTSTVVCSAPQSPEGRNSLAPCTDMDKPAVIETEVKTREWPPARSKKMASKQDTNSTSAYANEDGQEKNTSRRRLQIDDCNDYEEGLQISHSTEHKELATPRWHGAAQAMFEGPSLIPESIDATSSMRSSRYDKRSSSICDSPSPNYTSNDEDLRDANSLLLPSRSSGVVSSSSMYQTMKLNRATGSSNRFDGSFSDGFDRNRSGSGSGAGSSASGQIEAVQTGINRQSLRAFSPSEAGYSGVGRQPHSEDIDENERKGRSFSQLSADPSFGASRLPSQTNAMSCIIDREDRQRLVHTGIILTEGNSNNHRNSKDRGYGYGYSASPSKITYIETREDNRGVTRTEMNVRRSHENRSAGNSRFSPNRLNRAGLDSSRPLGSEAIPYEEDTVEDFVHLRHALDTLLAKNRVLEKEGDLARKRVLQLESESLVKHVEREEALSAFTSQQNQWTAELTAHILRNTALEQELRSKKEELEGSRIRLAADEAKIKSLTGRLSSQRLPACLSYFDALRSLPGFKFLFQISYPHFAPPLLAIIRFTS